MYSKNYNLNIKKYNILKMTEAIQQKFKDYLQLNTEISELRKSQTDKKKQADKVEKEIFEYMRENNMDCVKLNEGEIVLYEKKTSQTYKKEKIVEKLTEELKGNKTLAETLTESIINNKVFNTEPKIKAKLKKVTQ